MSRFTYEYFDEAYRYAYAYTSSELAKIIWKITIRRYDVSIYHIVPNTMLIMYT